MTSEQITNIGVYITAHEGLITNDFKLFFILLASYNVSNFKIEEFINRINNYMKMNFNTKEDENYLCFRRFHNYLTKFQPELITPLENYDDGAIFGIFNRLILSLNKIIKFNINNKFIEKSIGELINFAPDFRLHSFVNNILLPSFGYKQKQTYEYNQWATHFIEGFDNLNIAFDNIILAIDKDPKHDNIKYFLLKMLIKYSIHEVANIDIFTLLEPSEHVNAPVARNMIFNYIRQNENIYNNYIWLGSDADDIIDISHFQELKNEVVKYKSNNVILLETLDVNNGIKRYAGWSYLFSPIIYNRLSYRCSPMNKEDLDFFNRLHTTASKNNNIVNLSDTFKDKKIYEYQNSQGNTYNKIDIFGNHDIINYMNEHHKTEAPNILTPASTPNLPYEKKYYLNKSRNGYVFDNLDWKENMGVDQKEIYKYKPYYGLPVLKNGKYVNNPPTNAKKHAPLNNKTLLTSNEYRFENFNGDVYIIEYIATEYKHENSLINGSASYHYMFQNGKIPDENDLNNIGFYMFFEDVDISVFYDSFPKSDNDLCEQFAEWNEYIKEDSKTLIPIESAENKEYKRLFGGSSIFENILLFIALLVIVSSIIVFIMYAISHNKNNNHNMLTKHVNNKTQWRY